MEPTSLATKDLKEIVAEHELEVRGDESLLHVSKKSRFSPEQLIVENIGAFFWYAFCGESGG